jgi:hypothetical protein
LLRKKVEEKVISLEHVRSAENFAHLLTKALPRDTFDKLKHLLGIKEKSYQVGVWNIGDGRTSVWLVCVTLHVWRNS